MDRIQISLREQWWGIIVFVMEGTFWIEGRNGGGEGGGPGYFQNFCRKKGRIYEEQKGGNLLVINVMNSWGPIEQFVAIVAGCLPTHYSRKDARSSSDSVLRHQEDCTSGVEQVAEHSRKVERWRPWVVPQTKGRINWILLRYSVQLLPVLLDTRNAFAIISLGVEPPTNGREPDDFQPRAQIKRFFEKLNKLVSRNSEAIREFSDTYIVPKEIVAEVCWAPCPIKNAQREEAKRSLKLKRSQWSGWTGSTTILTGLDCTTPDSFNSLILHLGLTLSFQICFNFSGGGGGRLLVKPTVRFLMRDGKRNTLWIWCDDLMQKVCYTSSSLRYIREILGISANFFRVG